MSWPGTDEFESNEAHSHPVMVSRQVIAKTESRRECARGNSHYANDPLAIIFLPHLVMLVILNDFVDSSGSSSN